MEGDITPGYEQEGVIMFQSTPSHGGRLSGAGRNVYPTGFQSTPSHGGRRLNVFHYPQILQVSIHALTWRATNTGLRTESGFISFNPRPHMEGDTRQQ